MANKTINQLSQIDSLAGGDEFPIYDASTGTTKKATVNQINDFVADGAITDAINALDVPGVGGSGKYIAGISEIDGKINATEGTIDDTVTEENGNPVTSGAVASALKVPTDAVVHYSFDEIPDYPDGTADVRLLDNNTYDIQSSNYKFTNNGGATFSNDNGKLLIQISSTNIYEGAYIIKTSIANKIIKFKINVTSISGRMIFHFGGTVLLSVEKTGVYELVTIGSSSNSLYCAGVANTQTDCIFTVEQIYIGDGSYSTPIIDNANGQNNVTNNGGLAVQGVSGKGVCFFSHKYVDCGTDFQFSENFSCSIWCKPEDFSNNCQIVRKQGVLTLVIVNGDLKVYLYDSDGNALLNLYSLSNLPINQFTHIVVVRNGSSFKYYKNGVLIKTATLANTTINKNDNILSIGSNLTEATHIEDDLLIFDRALSEKEVTALYLNKANTPKYYDINNYKLTGIPTPPTTDGNYVLVANISSGVLTYSWVAQS